MMASLQVYSMDDALALDEASEVVQLLTTDERNHSAKQPPLTTQDPSKPQSVHTKRWREKISSRICLVRAVRSISQEYSIPEILHNIEKTHNGKPFFRELPFDFNFSHSRGMVTAVAVHKLKNLSIGIDLEVRPPHSPDIFARVCTQGEWTAIQSIETPIARQSAFLRRWCAKEAYVKALGVGLGYGFKNLEVQRVTDTQSSDTPSTNSKDASRPESWTITDQKKEPTQTHPIITWGFDSTIHGASCVSVAYASFSPLANDALEQQKPSLEFLINDGEGFPDFEQLSF